MGYLFSDLPKLDQEGLLQICTDSDANGNLQKAAAKELLLRFGIEMDFITTTSFRFFLPVRHLSFLKSINLKERTVITQVYEKTGCVFTSAQLEQLHKALNYA